MVVFLDTVEFTYASTNGPGYGSDFWYKLDNFKLNIIAGKNSTMHAIIPAHNPFCKWQKRNKLNKTNSEGTKKWESNIYQWIDNSIATGHNHWLVYIRQWSTSSQFIFRLIHHQCQVVVDLFFKTSDQLMCHLRKQKRFSYLLHPKPKSSVQKRIIVQASGGSLVKLNLMMRLKIFRLSVWIDRLSVWK